ncbi:MAG: DMT family transporter [Hyphomicrobiaceae bacterium]|nr:DMT family transporter [Hyphomicrobiaceae bacterium]
MTSARMAMGIAALLLTAALWGSNHVVLRSAHELMPLPAMAFWRWALALVILTPLAWPLIRRYREPLLDRRRDVALAGAIGVGLFSFLLLGGVYQSLALEVGMINATTPAWVALLAWSTGQNPTGWKGWAGLGLAFLGTVVILAKGSLAVLGALDIRLGNLWSLLAAMVFAWFSIRIKVLSKEIGALTLTVATAWAGLVAVMLPVYVLWLATGGAVLVYEAHDLRYAFSAVAYAGLGPALIGNVCYLFGVAVLGPQRAAAFIYLAPVFSAVLSVVWLGEVLQGFHFIGFVLIVSGLVMVNIDQRRSSMPPQQRGRRATAGTPRKTTDGGGLAS